MKLCSFLSSLHRPSSVSDLGVGGVSFVELLIPNERWAGEWLVLDMSVPILQVSGCDDWSFGRISWWSRSVPTMPLGCQSL